MARHFKPIVRKPLLPLSAEANAVSGDAVLLCSADCGQYKDAPTCANGQTDIRPCSYAEIYKGCCGSEMQNDVDNGWEGDICCNGNGTTIGDHIDHASCVNSDAAYGETCWFFDNPGGDPGGC
jgi:hypothetical protein